MLKDKDPSEIGFEGLLSYLKDTESTNFSLETFKIQTKYMSNFY